MNTDKFFRSVFWEKIVSIKGLDNNFMSNKSNNKYYSAAVLLSPSFTEELILKSFLPALHGITR